MLVASDEAATDAALDEREAREVDVHAREHLVTEQPGDLRRALGLCERGREADRRLGPRGRPGASRAAAHGDEGGSRQQHDRRQGQPHAAAERLAVDERRDGEQDGRDRATRRRQRPPPPVRAAARRPNRDHAEQCAEREQWDRVEEKRLVGGTHCPPPVLGVTMIGSSPPAGREPARPARAGSGASSPARGRRVSRLKRWAVRPIEARCENGIRSRHWAMRTVFVPTWRWPTR